jgi:AraC-like DNA-binding protein
MYVSGLPGDRLFDRIIYRAERDEAGRAARVFGKTMAEYGQRQRMGRETQLMESADLPVSDIAPRCGYWWMGASTRRSDAHAGCSPTVWRRHRDRTLCPPLAAETPTCHQEFLCRD